ncbi:MAG: hypothetical protein IKF91_05625 [Bacilli bacterium]|nr:hypothetical protein [Bacilli bacterium]
MINININGEEIPKKKIFIDMCNGEDKLISAFTKDGKRVNREDIKPNESASYHINVAKVFEKYYIDKEELDDLEKFLAIMFFTRTEDLYKIAGNDKNLQKLLEERKKVCEDPEMIKEYYRMQDEKFKKDFE